MKEGLPAQFRASRLVVPGDLENCAATSPRSSSQPPRPEPAPVRGTSPLRSPSPKQPVASSRYGGSATLLPGAFRWNFNEHFRRSYRDALTTFHLTLCICGGVPISRRHLPFMATARTPFRRQSHPATSPLAIGFAASAAERSHGAASPPPAEFRPTADACDGPRVLAGGAISFRASHACTASSSEAGARRMVVGGTTRARTVDRRRG